MKLNLFSQLFLTLLFLSVLGLFSNTIQAQTTAFSYQGTLNDNSAAATGTYQMRFTLFDAASAGNQIGTPIEKTAVNVNNGMFSVELDFGAVFSGAERFLQISVRRNSTESYVVLNNRQRIVSSPYAIKAANAQLLDGQPASAYGSASQVSALQTLVTTQQTQIQQLQAELAATNAGTNLWSKRFGSTGNDYGLSIAADNNGDVFVIGFFNGTVNFGGGGLLSAGGNDIFVAKYSGATGAHIWSKGFGSTDDDMGVSIIVDGSGNIFLTGYSNGTLNFGGVPLQSSGLRDVFLVKLSGTNGNHLWSKRFGGTSNDEPVDIDIDGVGDVVITGYFQGNADFGGLVLQNTGNSDIFVAKYSGSTGSHLWSRGFGGSNFGTEAGQGISTDSSGNVVVTGYFSSSTIDFGGGALMTAGSHDVFLVKLSASNGTHLWSKRVGGTNSDIGQKVAVDSNNNVLLTGYYHSSAIEFGGGSALANAGNADIFVVKYNSSGVHQWSKTFGGSGGDLSWDISVDGSGNPVVTGQFNDAVNFGGATLNNAGEYNIFVAKYAGTNGAHQWSRRFGGVARNSGQGLALDSGGNVFLTGQFNSSTLDFGGGPITDAAAGTNDIFVAKLMK